MADSALLIPGAGRGKRMGCVYGKSRRLKSVSMAALARWIYEKSGLRSRLVAIEGEGVEMFDDLIAADIVDAVFVPRVHPTVENWPLLEALNKLSQGWWPENAKESIWPLLKPGTGNNRPEDFGGFFWETWSATAQAMMSLLTTEAARVGSVPGRTKAVEGTGDRIIKSGEAEFVFAGMKDFGFCQQRTRELIVSMTHLPMPIKFGESLESPREAGDDKTYRVLPVVGPDIIGNATTERALAWLGPLIHLTGVEVQAQIDDPLDKSKKVAVSVFKPVMYTRTHIEPNDRLKVPCFADLRLANKSVLDKIPYASPTDVAGLYDLIDDLLLKAQPPRKDQVAVAVGATA